MLFKWDFQQKNIHIIKPRKNACNDIQNMELMLNHIIYSIYNNFLAACTCLKPIGKKIVAQ
jgi:hypothetical protein